MVRSRFRRTARRGPRRRTGNVNRVRCRLISDRIRGDEPVGPRVTEHDGTLPVPFAVPGHEREQLRHNGWRPGEDVQDRVRRRRGCRQDVLHPPVLQGHVRHPARVNPRSVLQHREKPPAGFSFGALPPPPPLTTSPNLGREVVVYPCPRHPARTRRRAGSSRIYLFFLGDG